MKIDEANGKMPVLENEIFQDTLIPETEVFQEELQDGPFQETQLIYAFQETQLLQQELCSPIAPEVMDQQAQLGRAPEQSQPSPLPEVRHSCGPQQEEADADVGGCCIAQPPQLSKRAIPEQPAVQTEQVAKASISQHVRLPLNQRNSQAAEKASSEASRVQTAIVRALPGPENLGNNLHLLAGSAATDGRRILEPCGVPTLTKLAKDVVNGAEEQTALPQSDLVGADEAALQSRAEAGQERSHAEKEKTPNLFDLEAVQFTAAAAATQGTYPPLLVR